MFEFFDGTSKCIPNANWARCNFIGTKPAHLTIGDHYPFQISADLSVAGGYYDSFSVQCTDTSANTYNSASTSFTQTCTPSVISPAVAIQSQNYDKTKTQEIVIADPAKTFFAGAECAQWVNCYFTGSSPLSISGTNPFPILADLSWLGGYTKYFSVTCQDSAGKSYTGLQTSFTETCIPTPVEVAIPSQNYDPSNKSQVILADSLTSMFEATDCVNWNTCVFNGFPAHVTIGSKFPFPITADLSVLGGYSTTFTVDCTDIEAYANTFQSTATFEQTCFPTPIPTAVSIPSQAYNEHNSASVIVSDPLTSFFKASECLTAGQWNTCAFVGTAPAHLSISSTYPFAISADLTVGAGYTDAFTVECSDNQNNVFTATQTSFTQTLCNLVKKAQDPAKISVNWTSNAGNQVIVSDTPSLFYDHADCQTVVSCTLEGVPSHVTISSVSPFAISADVGVVGGYLDSIQVSCKFATEPAVLSGYLAFEETCNLLPKPVADQVQAYNDNGIDAVIFSDIKNQMYTGSACNVFDSCSLVTPASGGNIAVTGSGVGPYAITAKTGVANGYTAFIQVQCAFVGEASVLSKEFYFQEDITLTKKASPIIKQEDFNGGSVVIVPNALETFFNGHSGVENTSAVQCQMVNAPTGVSMASSYPFAITAPSNDLSGESLDIQVECKLTAPIVTSQVNFVISNVAKYNQVCIPTPLPNVSIASRNYDEVDPSDVIVPNVLYEFFDGSSRCVSYLDWAKCEFVGSAPRHISILEVYPFELEADLRVLGGYTEEF